MRTDRVLSRLSSADPLPAELAASFDIELGIAEALRRGRSSGALARPAGRLARPGPLALAVLAVLALGAASALALGRPPAIDFFSAKPGPKVVHFALGQGRTGTTPPRLWISGESRRIASVRFGGEEHALIVAPLRTGRGFCGWWTGEHLDGGCVFSRAGRPIRLGVELIGQAPNVIGGSVLSPDAARLELRYEDGATEQIPLVWVSAPIDAGFFLHPIASEHRRAGHYPASLTLLDGSGHAIARVKVPQRRR